MELKLFAGFGVDRILGHSLTNGGDTLLEAEFGLGKVGDFWVGRA